MTNAVEVIRRVIFLAVPFGRRRAGTVILVSLAQGLFQVAGVTSIFPFLAIASNPGIIRESELGARILGWLPEMTDHQLLVAAGVLAITVLILSNAVNLYAEFHRKRYAFRFAHWLRLRLLNRIIAQPYSYFLQVNSSLLTKKVTQDVAGYTNMVLIPLLDTVTRAFTMALLLITLLLINPVLSLGFGFFLALAYGMVFTVLGRHRNTIRTGLHQANKGAMKEALQLFSGIKAIKVHHAENYFITNYARHSEAQARHGAWVPVLSSGPRYVIEPFVFGGLVLVVLILAGRGQGLIAVLPTLGVMAVAAYRLLPAIQSLYSDLTQISSSTHYLQEVYSEFEAATALPERRYQRLQRNAQKPPPLEWNDRIIFNQVTFSYPGAPRPVLDHVSIQIRKRTSVAVIGRTGSGKSTLIDLLLGLHQPTSGQIEIDGRPLTLDLVPSWQSTIGYVPQDIYLTDDTIARNIALGMATERIDRDQLREVCRMAQVLDFIEELPQGFETKVGERGTRLSGGQRQRLGIARALYKRPSLLVLDEATSALDTETESAVMSSITQLYGTLTIVIIAHRLTTIAGCDHRMELKHGQIHDGSLPSRV
jgi:ATP-binding cassette, subfamily B, bacterial PglK